MVTLDLIEKVNMMAEEIAEANKNYTEGHPTISDMQYDYLIEEVHKIVSDNNLELPGVLKEITGSNIDESIPEYTNEDLWISSFPMYSIKPAFNDESLYQWCRWLYNTIRNGNDKTMLSASLKADGFSFRAVYIDGTYVKANSRGRDGAKGFDITRHMGYLLPNKVDAKGIVEVRGEIVLPFDAFTKLQDRYEDKDFNNPRNSVSSLLKEDALEEDIKLLKPLAYSIYSEESTSTEENFVKLKEAGFKIVPHSVLDISSLDEQGLISTMYALLESFGEVKEAVGYLSDGLVVRIDDIGLVNELGGDGKFLTAVLALKIGPWKAKSYRAKITEIELSYGTKYISLVAKIVPVKTLSGRTVTSVNLNNIDLAIKARAYVGNYIEFEYVSDMIPKLLIYGNAEEV